MLLHQLLVGVGFHFGFLNKLGDHFLICWRRTAVDDKTTFRFGLTFYLFSNQLFVIFQFWYRHKEDKIEASRDMVVINQIFIQSYNKYLCFSKVDHWDSLELI
jgi:CO dehydrogenase/acetyl-CoA synthase gamma subunit (corrinoid Fe-S protein)